MAEKVEIETRPEVKEEHNLETFTNLLKSFDKRLSLIEKKTHQDTDTSPVGSSSATNTASAANVQKEFEKIRHSVSKVIMPPWFKVNDSPAAVKQENKPALEILSKSARYTETALKLLSTIPKNSYTSYTVSENCMNALYTTLSDIQVTKTTESV